MLIVSALSNKKHEIGRLVIQKLNILQAQCDSAVLLEHVKDQLSRQTRKFDRFARFCGHNCKNSNIWHQWTKFFTTKAG